MNHEVIKQQNDKPTSEKKELSPEKSETQIKFEKTLSSGE